MNIARNRQLLYIAGAYKGENYIEVSKNILLAKECAIWCANNDIFYFCPHTHSEHNNIIMPNVPVEFWYTLDMKILSHCDGIILLENWRSSYGANMERDYAIKNHMPMFLFPIDEQEILLYAKYN